LIVTQHSPGLQVKLTLPAAIAKAALQQVT
jgi:hypothetical protein